MSEGRAAACFTVHGLPHLHAALAAGAQSGRAVVALSGVGASGYAGADWFMAMIEQGRRDYPDVVLTAILDCADRAGDVLVAFQAGVRHVVFTGHPRAAERLATIAVGYDASILSERPQSLDLMDVSDPAYAARAFCRSQAR
jgi:DNA-binding transcriptional LysR family regulator